MFTKGDLVAIIPKSTRAKNRTKNHGSIMEFQQFSTTKNGDAYLFRSIRETWGTTGRKSQWLGWFTEKEASFEKIGK